MTEAKRASHCLDFWFSTESESCWFVRNDAFDARVRAILGSLHAAACAGVLEAWQDEPEGSLALVLLLDQVPRNLHRESVEAYAQDAKARAVARHAIRRGQDLRLVPERRVFLYMPFEHSEDLVDQHFCVALMGALPNREPVEWAHRHLDLIERFGRFPHRNAVLGRPSTPEEAAYLAEPGAGF